MKILLEGLTGAGKSQTIGALRRLGLAPSLVVPEEETYGEFMDELDDGSKDDAFRLRRLAEVRDRVLADPGGSFLLERLHPSYFALLPKWSLYDDLDRALAEAGTTLVLLHVGEDRLRARSLMREEYGHTDWQSFVAHFGSEEKALSALRGSQQRRFEVLGLTRMRTVTIDTGDKAWDDYARQIARLAS